MKKEIIEKTKNFLKQSFKENPHFSFNNWKIMYDHSLLVHKYSVKIAENIDCDKVVLAIGALLHDIGKTYKADEKTLRKEHEKLGYIVSKQFLETLKLTKDQKTKLRHILTSRGESVEKRIIKDADVIAFFADRNLQSAFRKWAQRKGLRNESRRKLGKINELRFNVSKEISKPFYMQLKRRWKL